MSAHISELLWPYSKQVCCRKTTARAMQKKMAV